MTNGVAEIALMTESSGPHRGAQEWEAAHFTPLVERARAGDLEAFDEIMIRTERRVVAIAWRMLGDREDARDATQEAFLRAYKYIRTFKEDQNFTGWLYRITVNVCRDMSRRKRAGAHQGGAAISYATEFEEGELETIAGSDDTESRAIEAQERAILARALCSLSEKERIAIVLRDMEGFSTKEVARILGSRPATVRSQISSARTKVKRYCQRFLRTGGKV